MGTILVERPNRRSHFWKGTTQGSFQQNLVEIGSVVSEKIFFKFHPPFFLFLASWPSWLEVGITGHNFGRGSPQDHSTKVWLQLTQWFLILVYPLRINLSGSLNLSPRSLFYLFLSYTKKCHTYLPNMQISDQATASKDLFKVGLTCMYKYRN